MNIDVPVFLWGLLVSVVVATGIATGEFGKRQFAKQRRSPDDRGVANRRHRS
jgi:hypothetical protein